MSYGAAVADVTRDYKSDEEKRRLIELWMRQHPEGTSLVGAPGPMPGTYAEPAKQVAYGPDVVTQDDYDASRRNVGIDRWQEEAAKGWRDSPPTQAPAVASREPGTWENATAAVRGDDPRAPGLTQRARTFAADRMEQVGTGAKTVYDYSPLASLHDVYTGITQNKGATLAAGIGGLIPGAGPEVRAAERAAERGAVSAAEREAERIAIANQNPVTGTLPESATRPTARNPANWSPSVLDDLDAQYREIPKSQTRVYTGADPTLPAEPTSTQKSAAAAATVQQRRELMPDEWLDTNRAPLLTDSRISQRVPTGANTFDIDPLRQDLRIDIDTMLKDPDYAHAAANAARTLVPNKLAGSNDPGTILYGARDQFMKNLDAIYSRLDPNIRDRATLWYPGGNTLAATMAARHGISTEAAAGTIAALSPQKDWYQNVEMADRIMKTASDNPTVTRELVDQLRNRKLQSGEPSGFAQYADELEKHIGSTFKDLPDREAGILAVAHDAMERTPEYHVLAPEGYKTEVARGKAGKDGSPGKPKDLVWQQTGSLENAVKAMRSGGDTRQISEAMGAKHKVRNFYNNLIAPDPRFNDYTNDTHNIAASLLMPIGSSDPRVGVGLGTSAPSSAQTGAFGLYGVYADAGRELAKKYGVAPYEVQSPTWEGMRSMFSAAGKKGAAPEIEKVWQAYRKGDISLERAQEMVFARAQSPNLVPWRND